MTGQTIILRSDTQRDFAKRLVDQAPVDAVVNIKPATRTNDQNALLWSRLSDVARAKPEGRVLTTETWKVLFMAEAGFKCRFELSLDGMGVVPVGFRSSRLNKAEFSDLLECVMAYGSQHGVLWTDPQ